MKNSTLDAPNLLSIYMPKCVYKFFIPLSCFKCLCTAKFGDLSSRLVFACCSTKLVISMPFREKSGQPFFVAGNSSIVPRWAPPSGFSVLGKDCQFLLFWRSHPDLALLYTENITRGWFPDVCILLDVLLLKEVYLHSLGGRGLVTGA